MGLGNCVLPLAHYRELIVWQKAVALVTGVYRLTANFPKQEMYGLTSQIRRSAASVPANVAEGQGRSSRGEFKQFLGHARGSLYELETMSWSPGTSASCHLPMVHGLLCRFTRLGECWTDSSNPLIAPTPPE
jgi:hypothetical protein